MTNEKRLQALAELQEDGERMEEAVFNHGGIEGVNYVKQNFSDWLKEEEKRVASILEGSSFACCCVSAKAAYKAGFNKALDLVMEEAEKEIFDVEDCHQVAIDIEDLKAIISKLRGEK